MSDSIVMMGELNSSLTGLKGFNKLQGQLAINSNKPFYVYDKQLQSMFKWNPTKENPLLRESGVFEVESVIPELGDRIAFFTPQTISNRDIAMMNNIIEKQAFKSEKGELSIDTAMKDKKMDINVSDLSPGEGLEIAVDTSLGGKINSYLSNDTPFIKKYTDSIQRQSKIKTIIETAYDTHKFYIKKDKKTVGEFETNSTDWFNEIQKKTKENLPDDLKGQLRQWLVAKKWGEEVKTILSDGTIDGTAISEKPINGKGELAPESVLEVAYNKYQTGIRQSESGVKHIPELTGKDLTKATREVRDTIEGNEGFTTMKGHKAVWFGPVDYRYSAGGGKSALHKAKKMPDNIREIKNEI